MNTEQQIVFLEKLKKLLVENNVAISFGCGCCGAGLSYKTVGAKTLAGLNYKTGAAETIHTDFDYSLLEGKDYLNLGCIIEKPSKRGNR